MSNMNDAKNQEFGLKHGFVSPEDEQTTEIIKELLDVDHIYGGVSYPPLFYPTSVLRAGVMSAPLILFLCSLVWILHTYPLTYNPFVIISCVWVLASVYFYLSFALSSFEFFFRVGVMNLLLMLFAGFAAFSYTHAYDLGSLDEYAFPSIVFLCFVESLLSFGCSLFLWRKFRNAPKS